MQIEQTTNLDKRATPSTSLLNGLAMVGGLGMTIVVVVLGLGAAGALPAAGNPLHLGILLGLGLLVIAIAGWFISMQPHRHFDDINQPLEHHDLNPDTSDRSGSAPTLFDAPGSLD